jgi:hypothetical protein
VKSLTGGSSSSSSSSGGGSSGGSGGGADNPPPPPGYLQAVGQLDLSAFGSTLADLNVDVNKIVLTFPADGGELKDSGATLDIPDFPWGKFIWSLTQGLGGGIFGVLGASGGDDSNIPPELANCRARLRFDMALTGAFDASAKTLGNAGSSTPTVKVADNCPKEAKGNGSNLGSSSIDWNATFDGTTARGSINAGGTTFKFVATKSG